MVGPDKQFDYKLSLFEVGPGNRLCATPMTISGETSSFLRPGVTSITYGGTVNEIAMEWINYSALTTRYVLYRDGEVLANLEATQTSFVDTYKFGDTTSIINGRTYEYCLEAYSEITNQSYFQICDEGKTYNINLTASDDEFSDKVALHWEEVPLYCDQIIIYRNGEEIETLPKTATTYVDNTPIAGRKSVYAVELVKNDESIVQVEDIGSVPKNGKIGGSVLTLENLYPVVGAKIVISGEAGDSIILDSVYTDFAGIFCFNELYYEAAASFTLTASLTDHTFEDNPKERTLIGLQPAIEDVIFLQDESFTTVEDLSIATNLTATPILTADKVNISWDYTPVSGDTTFFNLYRGSTLLAAINDANGIVNDFTDLTGEPGKKYVYKLEAFRIADKVSQVSLEMAATFPRVVPPANFEVVADSENGIATLTWATHSSTNFAGFFVYRNGERIATIPVDAIEYIDVHAAPNSMVTYAISAYRVVEEVTNESVLQEVNNVSFPALPAAESPEGSSGSDTVNIKWTVPALLTSTYNYTGFAVYRKELGTTEKELVAIKYKAFAPAEAVVHITDYTGKSSSTYTYEICTFLATPDTTYHANAVSIDASFSSVTQASNLQATEGYDRITLTWQSPESSNIDGIIIVRENSDSIGRVNAEETTFYDELPTQGGTQQYSIKPYRIVDGQMYYAIGINKIASTTPWEGSPAIPTKFTASKDLPKVVKLCWEYPEYALSEFIITKNGVAIDTLPTTSRAYYDYEGVKGQVYEYGIKTMYNSGTPSDLLMVLGRKKCANRLKGHLLSNTKRIGVPNVRVTATSTKFSAYVTTDQTGYYEFTNLPIGTITLQVVAGNAQWVSSTATVTINAGEQHYSQNFINNYEFPAFETAGLAAPSAVALTPNSNLLDVVINWSPGDGDYDGFEVYRDTKLLGEVAANENFNWVDKDGAPGYFYTYQVRAFQETTNERIYSDFSGVNAVFPALKPVTFLTGFSLPEENVLRLQWVHEQDVALSYVIERNGIPIATLVNPDNLEFIDITGSPKQLYIYTVLDFGRKVAKKK